MRSGNPHVSRSGLDTGSAHASSSSPSKVSEFGRMRIEIEILKNALSEQKKNNTKQAKVASFHNHCTLVDLSTSEN